MPDSALFWMEFGMYTDPDLVFGVPMGCFFHFVRVVGWRACFIDSFVDGYGGVQASGKWIGIKICTQQHGWWQLAVEKWMHIAFSMG